MNRVRGQGAGFTIVETMIFLAISGGLLVSAMALVGSQQRRTEFQAAVRDFDSKLQTALNNVASGYYNSRGDTVCTVVGGFPDPHTGGAPDSQGTNAGCTFIGQVITFVPNDDKATIYSVAGLRLNAGKEVTKLSDANPVLFNDTKEEYDFGGGLTIESVKLSGGDIRSIGVFTTFGGYTTGPVSTLASGSSRTNTYAYATASPGAADFAAATPVTSIISICLTNGDYWALIALNTGSTVITIGDNTIC